MAILHRIDWTRIYWIVHLAQGLAELAMHWVGLHVWLAVVKMIDSCNCHHHHQIIIIFIGGGAGGAERQLSPHLQTRGQTVSNAPISQT